MAPRDTQSDEFVTSVARGLAVIQAFGPDHARMSLSEVAKRTDLSRAAARRFLMTLCRLGFAKTDGKYFELTPKILSLGFAYLSSLGFPEIAQPHLEAVSAKLGESSSTSVLDGYDVVYVARSAAPHRIMSVSLNIGTRLPAHATSMGQVLLGDLQPKDLDAYLQRGNFRSYTPRTLTTPDDLRKRIEAGRRNGFVMCDQELEIGLRSLAVPVRGVDGATVASINVSVHAAQVSKRTMLGDYLAVLKKGAADISQSLILNEQQSRGRKK